MNNKHLFGIEFTENQYKNLFLKIKKEYTSNNNFLGNFQNFINKLEELTIISDREPIKRLKNISIINIIVEFIEENNISTRYKIMEYYFEKLWIELFPNYGLPDDEKFNLDSFVDSYKKEKKINEDNNLFNMLYIENDTRSDEYGYYYYFNKLNSLVKNIGISKKLKNKNRDYTDNEILKIFNKTQNVFREIYKSNILECLDDTTFQNIITYKERANESDKSKLRLYNKHFYEKLIETNTFVYGEFNIYNDKINKTVKRECLGIVIYIYQVRLSLEEFYLKAKSIISFFETISKNDYLEYDLCNNKIVTLYNFSKLFPKANIDFSLCIIFSLYLNVEPEKMRLLLKDLFAYSKKDNERFIPLKERKDFEEYKISYEAIFNKIKKEVIK